MAPLDEKQGILAVLRFSKDRRPQSLSSVSMMHRDDVQSQYGDDRRPGLRLAEIRAIQRRHLLAQRNGESTGPEGAQVVIEITACGQ